MGLIRNRSLGGYVRRFAVKSTIVGGVVYYTIQEGLWSSPEESVKLYGKIYNNVAPYVKENIPKDVANELPTLPSTSDISNFMKTNWNKGVMVSIRFLSELPSHATNGVNTLSANVKQYLESQTPSDKAQ